MRSYMIEDLLPEHMHRLAKHLKDKGMASIMDELYWLPVPVELLSEEQREHTESCGPHVLGLECGPTWLKMELLVRGRGRIRCSCVTYATDAQRAHMISSLDHMLRQLDIPV